MSCTTSHVVLNYPLSEASTRTLAAKFLLLNCTLNVRNRGTPSIKTRKIVTSKSRKRFHAPDSATCGSASRTVCRRQITSTQNGRPNHSDARSHYQGNTFRRMDYFLLGRNAPVAGHDVNVFRTRGSTASGRPANTVVISDRSCVMVAIENGRATHTDIHFPLNICHRAPKKLTAPATA